MGHYKSFAASRYDKHSETGFNVLFKVLPFSINVLVHSNKSVFKAVLEVFFGETLNGLF